MIRFSKTLILFALCGAFGIIFTAVVNGAQAQSVQNLPPGLVEQFTKQMGGKTLPSGGSQLDASRQSAPSDGGPVTGVVVELAPVASRLEKNYRDRAKLFGLAGQPLSQYGYDILKQIASSSGSGYLGTVSDSHRLGVGDEIIITLRGQVNETQTSRVDGEGRVLLPELDPLAAAGRRFGDFRSELEARVKSSYVETDVFVSLGAIRSVEIYVLGEVNTPGQRRLSSFATVIDALASEGGIRKTGSLRNVDIIRGNQRRTLDLYEIFLTGAGSQDLSLSEGDRIFVHPLGPTVAIGGQVIRPGIYELPSHQSGTVAEALQFAGGAFREAGMRFVTVTTDASGRDIVGESMRPSGLIGNGDIVLVLPNLSSVAGSVSLEGHVTVPGPRSVREHPTVRSLVGNPGILEDDPYLMFAVIQRVDERTRSRRYVPVDLAKILQGQADLNLVDNDRLIVLSMKDIRFFSKYKVGRVLNQSATSQEACGADCPAIFKRYPDLPSYLLGFAVVIEGEVRRVGAYPILAGVSLGDMIAVAGGLTWDVDLAITEVRRYDSSKDGAGAQAKNYRFDGNQVSLNEVSLQPADIVRFNPVYSSWGQGSVKLSGEFVRPGTYSIARGERLSHLIARAGGVTQIAYPIGGVYTRVQAREIEEKGFTETAGRLERSLLQAISSGDVAGESVTLVTGLVQSMRNTKAVGRVVATLEPTVLQAKPQLDPILSPGDSIHIPPRPNWVMVTGEVLQPGAQQFISGTSVNDYIRLAGGLTGIADDDRIYTILPDGRSVPLNSSVWNFDSQSVPPGSTVVIPLDPAPFDLMTFSRDIADILSKLALTAASVAVIGR